jgi:hypothetical protein
MAGRRKTARELVPPLAFGVSLARRGAMPVVSMIVCAVTVVLASVVAIVFASRGKHALLADVPILASSALAWGGGFLLAFAASAHALRRDRETGIRDLLAARTTSLRGYLVARVGGLAALLAMLLGGGTLACGLVAALAATKLGAVPATLQATVAGVVFSVAFAAVIAPVAFAALGARSRIGGYLFLLGIVVVPDLVAGMLSGVVSESVTEVLSIPSALGALRGALAPDALDVVRAVRALVALAVFAAVALAVVRHDAVRLERPEPAP